MHVAAISAGIPAHRLDRLKAELRIALGKTSKEDLKAWGLESGKLFGRAIGRRFASIGRAAGAVAVAAAKETAEVARACKDRKLRLHVEAKSQSAREGRKKAVIKAKRLGAEIRTLGCSIAKAPADYAPKILGATLGLMCGS